MIVRVMPDVSGIDKVFDYEVPARWVESVHVGSLVRIDLHGRRVAGWVVACDVEPPPGVVLREISKVSSLGPDGATIELARWAAHRWAGRVVPLMKQAMPDTMVSTLPEGPGPRSLAGDDVEVAEAFSQPGVTVVRSPPGADRLPYVIEAAGRGDGIVVVPSVGDARFLGGQLRRAGGRVALAGRDWALGAAGGTVIGSRKAVWARTRSLSSCVVLDEHLSLIHI